MTSRTPEEPKGALIPPKRRGPRPADGRSFAIIMIIAFLATLFVLVWTFRSLTAKQAAGATPGFRI